MAAKASRQTFTDAQKRAILQEVADSEGSIAQVLRKHNVGESTFYNWKKKVKAGATKKRATASKSKNVPTSGALPAAATRNSRVSIRTQDHMGPLLQTLRTVRANLASDLERVTKAIQVLEG